MDGRIDKLGRAARAADARLKDAQADLKRAQGIYLLRAEQASYALARYADALEERAQDFSGSASGSRSDMAVDPHAIR